MDVAASPPHPFLFFDPSLCELELAILAIIVVRAEYTSRIRVEHDCRVIRRYGCNCLVISREFSVYRTSRTTDRSYSNRVRIKVRKQVIQATIVIRSSSGCSFHSSTVSASYATRFYDTTRLTSFPYLSATSHSAWELTKGNIGPVAGASFRSTYKMGIAGRKRNAAVEA